MTKMGKGTRTAKKRPVKATEGEHAHVFDLPPPNGPISLGVCRLCGLEREFANSFEVPTWRRSIQTYQEARGDKGK